jgi:hypothetical protein
MPRRSMHAKMLAETGLSAEPERYEPPAELDEKEAEEWRKIVNSMPIDHFIPANLPLLLQLCRHIVDARVVSGKVRAFRRPGDSQQCRLYIDLLRQQDAESLAISRLSRAMRLTQQSHWSRQSVLPKRRQIAASVIENQPWND